MTLTQETELDIPVAESFPLTGAQSVILALFRQRGSFTDSELNDWYFDNAELLGLPPMRYDSPRKRRSDLARLGNLTTDGSTRPNRFGGQEKVWSVKA